MDKQLSKEDIIATLDGVSDGWQTTFPHLQVEHAMDTYAKQEAIAFLEWENENGYRKVFDGWENDSDIEIIKTTEQLYSLYQSK